MPGSINNHDGYVYLDYAATAPLCEEALEAMEPYLKATPAGIDLIAAGMNPNSLHAPGRAAFRALERARRDVASVIGADRPDTVTFTSGATEADNMAVRGIALAAAQGCGGKPHVITSAIEHDAVLECAKGMKRDGFAVDILYPDRDGFIEVRQLEHVLAEIAESGEAPLLVSVQAANSEIGSIQPVRQLADCAHSHGAYFHTDATQALGKMPVDVSEWDVDAASFSSHKVSGPRGIGALYVRKGIPMRALFDGGGQEGGRRSGTQDVCSAAGFAAAAGAASRDVEGDAARLREFRDDLYERLAAIDPIQPTVQVDRGSMDFLPNIVNVFFEGYESNTLLTRYDALGFGVSGGSACSSDSTEPSHVLKAIGLPDDQALGEVRVSFGRYTTRDDIDGFMRATLDVLDWERSR